MSVSTDTLVHLTPDDYHVIGPDDFGAPGLSARESIGPFTDVRALGSLVTVHDSRFEAGCGIGHHPHQGMERLFYILEGTVDHDDALNDIQGHMGTGDLGILTEGRRGMVHSEWNNGEQPARAYILVYPTEPTPPTASFGAIRETETETVSGDGVRQVRVVTRETQRLHGDLRELSDTRLDEGASVELRLRPDEAGLIFIVDGCVEVRPTDTPDTRSSVARRHHTVLAPPSTEPRRIQLTADRDSRVLHALTGRGFGLRRAS